MEALPICLNKLVPELLAVMLSVTAVLIFGEILPQAICTGPNQIAIASKLAPYTRALMMMEGFLAYPISLMLDCFLGEHTTNRYKNSDLKVLIELHTRNAVQEMQEEQRKGHEQENRERSNSNDEPIGLSREQSKLISGAIDLTSDTAEQVMRPYELIETIDYRQQLTQSFLLDISEKGYSRYPVYKDDKHNVIGILLVKKLLGLTKFDMSIEKLNVPLRMPLIVHPKMLLSDLLVEFQKGKSHIALVTEQPAELKRKMFGKTNNEQMQYDEAMRKDPAKIMGIVTLEDVVEKVIGEIMDEGDYDEAHRVNLRPRQIPNRSPKPFDTKFSAKPPLPPIDNPGKILTGSKPPQPPSESSVKQPASSKLPPQVAEGSTLRVVPVSRPPQTPLQANALCKDLIEKQGGKL